MPKSTTFDGPERPLRLCCTIRVFRANYDGNLNDDKPILSAVKIGCSLGTSFLRYKIYVDIHEGIARTGGVERQ